MAAKKHQNKYHIASVRMKNYNYASNAAYFVSIVTKNSKHFFGDIVDDDVVDGGDGDAVDCKNAINRVSLSKIGKIDQNYWDENPTTFSVYKIG